MGGRAARGAAPIHAARLGPRRWRPSAPDRPCKAAETRDRAVLNGIGWLPRGYPCGPTVERDHVLALLAEVLDPEAHHVARLEEALRLHAHAHPGRSARGDHVSRLEDHEMGDVRNELGAAEDHRLGGARLHSLAVDVEPHGEVLHVGNLVFRDEPGPERTEGWTAFALRPGAAALELKLALRHVVTDAEPGHVVEGVIGMHIARLPPDYDREFHLPVGFLRCLGNHHLVVRSDDAGRCLVE